MGTVFGGVPLGGGNGYRRFASRVVLPLGGIEDEHRLPFINFGKTLLFSPRDGVTKGKKRPMPWAGHRYGHIVPVAEIAAASLFAATRQESLPEQSLARQWFLRAFTMLENARRFSRRLGNAIGGFGNGHFSTHEITKPRSAEAEIS